MDRILFLPWHQPDKQPDHKDVIRAREHVRKAVLRDRGQRNIQIRVKQFTGSGFVKVPGAGTSRPLDHPSRNQLRTSSSSAYIQAKHEFRVTQPSTQHPYTACAAGQVTLLVEKIDVLFRSRKYYSWKSPQLVCKKSLLNIPTDYFRNAGEPLFDTAHVAGM
jgi:hypothetical protein